MRQFTTIGLVLVAILVLRTPLYAGSNENAKISGHLQNHVMKSNPCENPPLPPCNEGEENLAVHGELQQAYDLFLLVLDADPVAGVAGAEFGIEYKGAPQAGMDVFSWTLCADLEFGSPSGSPQWPEAGSGNIITWDRLTSCQREPAAGDFDGRVTAVLGALYVYAYGNDKFKITKRETNSQPVIAVADCSANAVRDTLNFPQAIGVVSFGNSGGERDPCN